jgi:hypothetical protein
MDDDEIPAWMRRPLPPASPTPDVPVRRAVARAKKIPYPKDGYKCVGMRAEARTQHKARLKTKWERRTKR